MKITDVRTHLLEARLTQPFAYSRAWYSTRTALIVEIETDEGLVGWGESYGPARINRAAVESMRPLLLQQDAMRTEWLWHEIYARFRDHGQKGAIIQGLSGIYVPHVWGTGIALAAALQLLAVLPALTPPSLKPIEPMLEFDRTEHPIRRSLLVDAIEHRKGIVGVPEGPGLGIEVNREALRHFRIG